MSCLDFERDDVAFVAENRRQSIERVAREHADLRARLHRATDPHDRARLAQQVVQHEQWLALHRPKVFG